MITKEMEEWFKERTTNHIARVGKWYERLTGDKLQHHDDSKWEEPEYTPYVYITWDYRMKREGKPFEIPEDIKENMNLATQHHILSNRHHPEYWDDNYDPSMLNRENRDAVPDTMVDATGMPDDAIQEMCADWLAMSEEKGTNPYDWAEMNINKRWKFTEDQVDLIFDCISLYDL